MYLIYLKILAALLTVGALKYNLQIIIFSDVRLIFMLMHSNKRQNFWNPNFKLSKHAECLIFLLAYLLFNK